MCFFFIIFFFCSFLWKPKNIECVTSSMNNSHLLTHFLLIYTRSLDENLFKSFIIHAKLWTDIGIFLAGDIFIYTSYIKKNIVCFWNIFRWFENFSDLWDRFRIVSWIKEEAICVTRITNALHVMSDGWIYQIKFYFTVGAPNLKRNFALEKASKFEMYIIIFILLWMWMWMSKI